MALKIKRSRSLMGNVKKEMSLNKFRGLFAEISKHEAR